MIVKYRRKPEVFEVIQFTGENEKEIKSFAGDCYKYKQKGFCCNYVYFKSIDRALETGDFLLKDKDGMLSVLFKYELEELYERAND